ncbi:MAG: hypothetical protein A2X36_14080 [Elusimicrobia bacterium GWA2_69_24]|nr:MAG: hypothetical protein A2X36_14080 [Elusimicrobia bacterium GWA2_69_24]
MLQKVATLETLVGKAAAGMKKLHTENAKLRKELSVLHEENGALQMQFKRFKAMSQRQELVRTKLERTVKRLDRVMELTGC